MKRNCVATIKFHVKSVLRLVLRLRQLPLNLKIKKEIVLQLLTAVRGRNGKRKKKEGIMLPYKNSQMEVGTLGG